MNHALVLSTFALMLAAAGHAQAPQQPPATPSVAEQVAAMPLDQRIAQLMLVTLQGGLGADHGERQLLKTLPPAGVVLAPPTQPGQTALFITGLRRDEQAGAVPLFIATDLRRVLETPARPIPPYLQIPSLLAVAATRDPRHAGAIEAIAGRHLTTMGFNASLGPSLAVAPLLASGDGTLHGYGSDIRFATAAGTASVTALAQSGLLAIVRDFPGGPGLSTSNELPVLVASESMLAERHLPPFRAAVDAGVPAIQLANVIVPAYSPEHRPAPLTPHAIQSVLRGQLGFQGLVVAGPMDDPGLAPFADPVQSCAAALNAGADLLYWQGQASVLEGIVPALRRAVEAGRIPEARVNEAVTRILTHKQTMKLAARPLPEQKDADRLPRDTAALKTLAAIERQSLTLVKNADGILPLTREQSTPVLVTGIVGVRDLKDRLKKALKNVGEQPMSTARHIGDIADFEVFRVTRQVSGVRTVVLVLGPTIRPQGQRDLVRGLKAEKARVVLVYLGHPNEVAHLMEADAVLLAYADPRLAATTLDAVADVLLGKAAVAVEPPAAPLRARVGEDIALTAADWLRAPAGRLPVDVSADLLAGAAVSYDATACTKSVQWSFSDGKRGKGLSIRRRFDAPGRYSVTLAATDLYGDTREAMAVIEIE